jgi:hypothetical protein
MSQPPVGPPAGQPWPLQKDQQFLQQPTVQFPPPGQSSGGFPPPQLPRKTSVYQRPWFAVLALFLVVGTIGSALDGKDGNSTAVSATTPSESPSPEPVAPPVSSTPTAPVAPPASAAPTTPAPTTPEPAAVPPTQSTPVVVDFAMPAVVGMDLQSAQNLIQTNGVFVSLSHDLLGTRAQVLDANWTVCTQNIPAGERVTGEVEGAIDLGVVKLGEPCP